MSCVPKKRRLSLGFPNPRLILVHLLAYDPGRVKTLEKLAF
jgi:hypothetical protein